MKVILICGKLCSGKSVYAEKVRAEEKAVILSCDELMLALFDERLGARHEEVSAAVQEYLFKKAIETAQAGANVILEWGFWTEAQRRAAERRLDESGVARERRYVDVSEETWKRNIAKRNAAVQAGMQGTYFVDEGLLEKMKALFETPEPEKIDVWYENEWSPD